MGADSLGSGFLILSLVETDHMGTDSGADSKSCENKLSFVIGCDRSAYPIRRNLLPRESAPEKFLTFDTNSTSD